MKIDNIAAYIIGDGIRIRIEAGDIPIAQSIVVEKEITSDELSNLGEYHLSGEKLRPFNNGKEKGMELVIEEPQKIQPLLTEILWTKKGTILKIRFKNVPVVGEIVHEEIIGYDVLKNKDGFTLTFTSVNPIVEDGILKALSLQIAELPGVKIDTENNTTTAKHKDKSRRKKFEHLGYILLGTVTTPRLRHSVEVWYHENNKSFNLYNGEVSKSDKLSMSMREERFNDITKLIFDKNLLPSHTKEIAKILKPELGTSESSIHIWRTIALFKKLIKVSFKKQKVIMEKAN